MLLFSELPFNLSSCLNEGLLVEHKWDSLLKEHLLKILCRSYWISTQLETGVYAGCRKAMQAQQVLVAGSRVSKKKWNTPECVCCHSLGNFAWAAEVTAQAARLLPNSEVGGSMSPGRLLPQPRRNCPGHGSECPGAPGCDCPSTLPAS